MRVLLSYLRAHSFNDMLAGLFYIIDGFLDVSIPQDDPGTNKPANVPGGVAMASTHKKSKNDTRPELKVRTSGPNKSEASGVGLDYGFGRAAQLKQSKHLFTVKTGGIAGYLGQ